MGGEYLHHSWDTFYVCVVQSHKRRQGEQQEVSVPLNLSKISGTLSIYSYHFRYSHSSLEFSLVLTSDAFAS